MNAYSLLSPIRVVVIVSVMVVSGGSFLSPAHDLATRSYDLAVSALEDAPVPTPEESINASGAGSLGIGQGSAEMEQHILATTLRITIETWLTHVEGQGYVTLFGDGHGTVLGGRYLLTHNHFRLPLVELLTDNAQGDFATMTLYTADGSLLWQGRLTTASVAHEDPEALLLEFPDRAGRGFFDALGIPSADISNAGARSLPAGAIVAQVNWDTEQAYVQWTSVKSQEAVDGTRAVKLSDCLVPGSSGGGLFLDGVHIGNNWSRSQDCVQAGSDANQLHSTAALNSTELLAALAATPS